MSKYIIKVNGSSAYPEDIDAAFVNITDDLLKTIEARRRVFDLAKQEDDLIYSMRYWCGVPEGFGLGDDMEEFEEGSMLVDDDFACKAERIECVTMVVTEDGIAWTFYQKHCDIELRTDILSYKELKESA
jgi:hypothetical protein